MGPRSWRCNLQVLCCCFYIYALIGSHIPRLPLVSSICSNEFHKNTLKIIYINLFKTVTVIFFKRKIENIANLYLIYRYVVSNIQHDLDGGMTIENEMSLCVYIYVCLWRYHWALIFSQEAWNFGTLYYRSSSGGSVGLFEHMPVLCSSFIFSAGLHKPEDYKQRRSKQCQIDELNMQEI